MTIKTEDFSTYDEIYGLAMDSAALQCAAARGRRLQAKAMWQGLGAARHAIARRIRQATGRAT
jgi:hypothetical protein